MGKKTFFCLVIASFISFFANFCLAATIVFDYHVYCEPNVPPPSYLYNWSNVPVEEQLLGIPVTPGPFQQQLTSTGNFSASVYFREGPNFDPSTTPSTTLDFVTYLWIGNSTYSLEQTPPRFASATWKILVTINGVSSTLFDQVADPDLLQNGGVKEAAGAIFTTLEVPLTWYFDEVQDRWLGFGDVNTDITVFAEQHGVVVPIPGAFWLLGSGLLSLAGWRRLKNV